jgi:FkbM family methyltransferase
MKILLKKFYSIIPWKQKLFYALKSFWKPPESIYRHLHFAGVFTVFIEKGKSFKIKHYGYQIENEIFWEGIRNGWEKESINLWIKLCADATVVLDIGANTGVYSLLAKALNPQAKVFAFEPVTRVFKKLEDNIALNHFDIVPIEKAVSDFNGSAIIYDTPSEHVYSVAVNKNLTAAGTQVIETTINTTTLNSFLKENNISHVDLVKIDVETHEPEVLNGFSDFLFQCKPTILIEVLTDDVGDKIDSLFKGSGYLYFNINESGGIRQVTKITKSDYYNYLFCSKSTASKLGLLSSL